MLKFNLNGNIFSIEGDLDLLLKIDKSIRNALFWDHFYSVSCNVSNEVFQSFLDYWTQSKELDICFDNFNEFVELNNKFHLDHMDELLKEKETELEINDLTNINALKDPQIKSKSYYETLIAKKLDHYISRHGEELMKCPITSLINIFNHQERNLFNHNYAYELISKYTQKTNENGKFLLFQFIDVTQLNKKNYNDSISIEKLRVRCSLMPNINVQYLGTILNDIAQFNQEKEELMQLKDYMKSMAKSVSDSMKCMKYEVKMMKMKQAELSLFINNEISVRLEKAEENIESIQNDIEFTPKIPDDLLDRLADCEKSAKSANDKADSNNQSINSINNAINHELNCLKYEVKKLKKAPKPEPVQERAAPDIPDDLLDRLEKCEKSAKDANDKADTAGQKADANSQSINNINNTINQHVEDHKKLSHDLNCLKYEVKKLKKAPKPEPVQ